MEKSTQVNATKKLVLKKQSLRNLTELQLDALAGGRMVASAPHGPGPPYSEAV
jgi:hypothetical protein